MSGIILSAGAPRRIGFVSTRFHGTDGVTLEAEKWAHILTGQGQSCYWMAGMLDTPPEASFHAPLAFFNHPAIAELQGHLFGKVTRTRAVTNQVQAIKEQLKDELYREISDRSADSTKYPGPPHARATRPRDDRNHQRDRPADDRASSRFFLGAGTLHGERGQRLFEGGVSPRPAGHRARGHQFDGAKGTGPPLQSAFIHYPGGDEGGAYMQLLRERIEDARIDARFITERVGDERGVNAAGQKVYSLFDLYPHTDLVTYPSFYEGFGNAFLEAVYFRKPVVVNTYVVYARDIAPLGFKTIEMTQLVSNQVVEQTREILRNKVLRGEWAETNYKLGLKYFSYAVTRRKLAGRLANLFGEGV